MHRIGNHLVLFNLGWVASIIFMAKGMPGMALGCMTLVLASHLAVIAAPLKEAVFLACVAVFGTVIASAILATGLVGFTTVLADPGTVITWMIGLWMLFAANINTGFNQIKRSWWTAAIGGTVLGGLTYFALAGLGMIESGFGTLAVFSLAWAIVMPILALVADTIIDSAWLEPHSSDSTGTDASLNGLEFDYMQR